MGHPNIVVTRERTEAGPSAARAARDAARFAQDDSISYKTYIICSRRITALFQVYTSASCALEGAPAPEQGAFACGHFARDGHVDGGVPVDGVGEGFHVGGELFDEVGVVGGVERAPGDDAAHDGIEQSEVVEKIGVDVGPFVDLGVGGGAEVVEGQDADAGVVAVVPDEVGGDLGLGGVDEADFAGAGSQGGEGESKLAAGGDGDLVGDDADRATRVVGI